MNRRQFVRTVSQSSIAMMLGLHATRMWGQPAKQLPVDCSPPNHGAPKHITFDTTTPVQPRKSVWDLSPTELTRLQNAYQKLRDLTVSNPNDPRGWMQQANVHCFNCSGGYDPSNVEIHGSWWFLPWHRCYLHVHERILANLVGDPTFRLAYWDWDTYPTHAILPPPFVPPNPLYDAYRGALPTDVIPADITGPAAMSIVLGTSSTFGFMGGPSDPSKGVYNAGALENSPHGPVHIWTGYPGDPGAPEPVGCFYPNTDGGTPVDQSNNGCMDMGVLATAAQDPIFFAHHSNIDRMWDVWLNTAGSQGNWNKSSWLNQQFTFYDENGDWVYITVADVLDAKEQTNLRYTYQPPQTSSASAELAAAPPPAKKSTAVRAIAPLVVHSATAPTPVGTKPHVKSVAVPQQHQNNLRSFATAGKAAAKRYVLHIDGFSLPPGEGTIVHVYVGDIDPAKANANSGSFVGTFSVVASGHRHAHQVVRNARFEIRPATAALLADQKTLTVTLIPARANGSEPKQSSLTYKKIYLSVE